MKSCCLLLALVTGTLLLAARRSQAQVVISEIMYHPVEEPAFNSDGTPVLDLWEDMHEFIELHNPGADAISLSGWQLVGGVDFVFPAEATIQPGEFIVVAKDPPRLKAVVDYGLASSAVFGPWLGRLNNSGETVRLQTLTGETVDEVTYSADSPWPIGANALGAGDDWTGLKSKDYQYRGRSLERVSFAHPADDPANWLASPLPGNPSPGRPNAVALPTPRPVVLLLEAYQDSSGQSIIRRNQPVRIDCLFSAVNELSEVKLEYFVDDINLTNEVSTTVPMPPVGDPGQGRFTAVLSGFADRNVVRYRVRANRGAGEEVVSPRADDPFRWQAFFVTPVRASTNDIYDLFISAASIRQLASNLADNPNSGYSPKLTALPNGRWNNTEPAVFVHNGLVRDARTRYNGSFYRRSADRQSYKVELPRYNLLNNQSTLLVTDKDSLTVASHKLFREVGLPSAQTRWVDLYVNTRSKLLRLEIEEHDEHLLERYHAEQAWRHPSQPPAEPGRIFKSSGILENRGPYGRGEGSQFKANSGWAPLQRYQWTYSLKTDNWQGYAGFKKMIDGLATARGNNAATNVAAMRAYFEANWDLDKELTYLAVRNWMSTWDDTVHNFFLWQQRNNRWSMLPWDFDADMGGGGDSGPNISIFRGEASNPNNTHGTHIIKDSFFKAFRQEYRERLFLLNNTFLHPDNVRALGLTYASVPNFARARFTNVNNQLKLGVFSRPEKPFNVSLRSGESAFPPATLRATPYRHNLNPAPAHQATRWEIRSTNGTYSAPVFSLTSASDLTALAAPFELLKFGETYFWRCTYLDADGHPSVASEESSFRFGGSAQRLDLLAVDGATVWKYNEAGVTLAADWRGPQFDDSTWSAGPALLGVSPSALQEPIRTPLALGQITYYFRAQFDFQGDPVKAVLRLRHFIDDGVVFYLNGTEILRTNVPTGSLLASVPATRTIQDPVWEGPFVVNARALVRGANVLAAEVHQINSASPDVVFGAALEAALPVAPSSVVLNEVMARNDSAVANAGRHPDWIELHNPTDEVQSLTGLSLTDDALAPGKFTFPPGASIPPRGYLVVWCDNRSIDAGLHTGFTLSAEGGSMTLSAATATGPLEVDSIMFGLQLADLSIGRQPDGQGAWQLNVPTPRAANTAHALGSATRLRINEWQANPTAGDDWFELYNPEPLPVELSGLFLTDTRYQPTNSRIAALSFLAPGGFQVFFADARPANGADHVNFKLSAARGLVGLFAADRNAIDVVSYGAQAGAVSQGRLPDGGFDLVAFPDGATPGRSNVADSDGDGVPDPWETAHGLDLFSSGDAGADADTDGHSNLEEFRSGTDPQSANSNLKLDWAVTPDAASKGVTVRFIAVAGRSYTVQFAEDLRADSWQKLQDVAAQLSTSPIEVTDANALAAGARYYRVVTPQQP